MPLFTIQDWIAATHIGGGQAETEEEIVTDYAGCKCKNAISGNPLTWT